MAPDRARSSTVRLRNREQIFAGARFCLGPGFVAACLTLSGPGMAADTLEPYDLGLSAVELYVGAEGFGRRLPEQAHGAEAVLGYGVTPRWSLYAAPSFLVDGYLLESALGLKLGSFVTPLDTEHLDLDLGATFGTDGTRGGLCPFVELNLDLRPDGALAGLYARGSLDLVGSERDAGAPALEVAAGGTVGAYVTVASQHQLLLELDASVCDGPRGRVDGEIGALHLGHNLQFLPHAELITELSLDLPGHDEPWAIGFLLGLVATLPADR